MRDDGLPQMRKHLQPPPLRDPLLSAQTRMRGRLCRASLRLEVLQAIMPQAQVRTCLREPHLQTPSNLIAYLSNP